MKTLMLTAATAAALAIANQPASASRLRFAEPANKARWQIAIPRGNSDQYQGAARTRDGAIWFTDTTGGVLLRYTAWGTFTTYPVANALTLMTLAPDGYLYATVDYEPIVDKISSAGDVTPIDLPSVPGSLAAGTDGGLWITQGHGVARLGPKGNLTSYALGGTDDIGAGSSITQQAAGDVWFDAMTPDGNSYLAQLKPRSGKIVKYFQDGCGDEILPTIAAPDGRVWAVCDGWYDGFAANGDVTRVKWPSNLGFGMIGAYDNAQIGPDGAIWIVGANVVSGQITQGAMLRFDVATHRFHKYIAPSGYEWGSSLAFDGQGDAWAGTQNGQLQRLIP